MTLTAILRRILATLEGHSESSYYGKLEVVQQIAEHESPRTTTPYDRCNDDRANHNSHRMIRCRAIDADVCPVLFASAIRTTGIISALRERPHNRSGPNIIDHATSVLTIKPKECKSWAFIKGFRTLLLVKADLDSFRPRDLRQSPGLSFYPFGSLLVR